jgi:hypothetical protein
MPTGGKGNESGTPFITLLEDSTLHGVTIYYPDQPGDQIPSPFPWFAENFHYDMSSSQYIMNDAGLLL